MLVRYEFCLWSRRSSRFSTHADVFPNVAHRGLDGAVILVQPLSFALGDGYCGDKDNDGDKDDDEGSGGDDDDDYDDSSGVVMMVMQRLMQPLRQPLSFAPKSS